MKAKKVVKGKFVPFHLRPSIRRGPGRPKLENPRRPISVRLDHRIAAALAEVAETEERHVTECIEEAVAIWLDARAAKRKRRIG